MRDRKPLIGLIGFLVISVLATWTLNMTLQRQVSGSTDSYTAVFTDVSGLRTGDDVRMAGVRVGRVGAIELAGSYAEVTFEVQREQVLYGDTIASVTYQNLIGQRYVGLSMGDFGDSRTLRPGAVLPVERTEPSFDLSKLLNGFEPLFSVLSPDAVDNITDAIVRALQGDNGAVTSLIAQTSSLAQAFAGPDELLGRIVDNLSGVVTTLAEQSENLRTIIGQTRKIFEGLGQQRDELFNQVDSISTAVGRAARVVQGAQPSMLDFVTRQPGFARHFLENKDEFAYLGFNLPLMLKSMSRVVDSGAYVSAYVCDIRLSVVPGVNPVLASLLGAATPSGRAENSPMCR